MGTLQPVIQRACGRARCVACDAGPRGAADVQYAKRATRAEVSAEYSSNRFFVKSMIAKELGSKASPMRRCKLERVINVSGAGWRRAPLFSDRGFQKGHIVSLV